MWPVSVRYSRLMQQLLIKGFLDREAFFHFLLGAFCPEEKQTVRRIFGIIC